MAEAASPGVLPTHGEEDQSPRAETSQAEATPEPVEPNPTDDVRPAEEPGTEATAAAAAAEAEADAGPSPPEDPQDPAGAQNEPTDEQAAAAAAGTQGEPEPEAEQATAGAEQAAAGAEEQAAAAGAEELEPPAPGLAEPPSSDAMQGIDTEGGSGPDQGQAAAEPHEPAPAEAVEAHKQPDAEPLAPASVAAEEEAAMLPTVTSSGQSIRQYLDTTVVPVLRLGLRELVRARPADPFDFLADFIRDNKPK